MHARVRSVPSCRHRCHVWISAGKRCCKQRDGEGGDLRRELSSVLRCDATRGLLPFMQGALMAHAFRSHVTQTLDAQEHGINAEQELFPVPRRADPRSGVLDTCSPPQGQ